MDIVKRAAQLFGNAPALRMSDQLLSFNECNVQAEAIAVRLAGKGVLAGDSVALVSPNTPELVLLMLGMLKAEIIAAPLNYRFPEHLLGHMLEKLHPRLTLTASKTNISSTTIASFLSDTSSPSNDYVMESVSEMNRPVSIIHTSASSGEAKAALHSFANHWYSALGSHENIPFGNGDCWLLSLPLYHIGGYAMLFRSLMFGGALAVAPPDEPLDQSLHNFPLTHLSVVPTQLYRLLAHKENTVRLRSMKAVLLGGSTVPKSLLEDAVRKEIPLYISYGSTEMSSQIATTSAVTSCDNINAGKLLRYREICVADDGELLVKGECLFQGYVREGKLQPQTDRDGWFHTSDIGSVTDDGVVTVIGRKDNMFIAGGENIHPEEIEAALMMIDGIIEALVVPAPDVEYGTRPVAFIKTVEVDTPDNERISSTMNALVGKLKSPTRYYRVREWTKLPGSQKINRKWYKQHVGENEGF